jgi:hypothetical protein
MVKGKADKHSESETLSHEVAHIEKEFFKYLTECKANFTDDDSKLAVEMFEEMAKGSNQVQVMKKYNKDNLWLYRLTTGEPSLMFLFLYSRYMYALFITAEIPYLADDGGKKAFTNQLGESVECQESVRRVQIRIDARKFEAARIIKSIKFMMFVGSLREKAEAVMNFALRGEIPTDTAKDLMDVIKIGAEVIKTADIDERLTKLEEDKSKPANKST